MSGNTRPQSSQLAEPLWTDPGIKSGISVREIISTLKKKKRRWGMKGRTFSLIPCKRGNSHHHHHHTIENKRSVWIKDTRHLPLHLHRQQNDHWDHPDLYQWSGYNTSQQPTFATTGTAARAMERYTPPFCLSKFSILFGVLVARLYFLGNFPPSDQWSFVALVLCAPKLHRSRRSMLLVVMLMITCACVCACVCVKKTQQTLALNDWPWGETSTR